MQLYVIDWSFQNSEDQLFATNEFCKYFNKGKLDQLIEGFELKFIAHFPENGSGIIVCKSYDIKNILSVLKMWRDNYSISFNIKPALTSEELVALQSSKDFFD